MSDTKPQDIKDSISELSDYRQRLAKEVITMAQKLKMPPKQIDAIIKDHAELTQISKVLSQLKNQLKKLTID